MKCGTTSLHNYLDLHPDIFMSEIKELDYFVEERSLHKGQQWYESQFPVPATYRGESSQNYTKRHMFAGVPARLHALVPDARLIYLVRDPLKRIRSHFYENLEGGEIEAGTDINSFLADFETHHYVLTSRYYYQLSAWLSLFPKENMLVVTSESLQSDRLRTMNEIFRFLGLDEINDPSVFDFKKNTEAEKRVRTGIGKWFAADSFLKKLLPSGLKDQIRASSLFRKVAMQEVKQVEIDPALLNRIREFLRPDVEQLRSFSGKKFTDWNL
jgi:hypothetical protein